VVRGARPRAVAYATVRWFRVGVAARRNDPLVVTLQPSDPSQGDLRCGHGTPRQRFRRWACIRKLALAARGKRPVLPTGGGGRSGVRSEKI